MKFLLFFIFITALNANPFPENVTKTTDHLGGRIIGGQVALPGQYPYAAAVYVNTANSRHFCAGTLLSDQWILTAGQCVVDAELFLIFLGSIYLETDDPGRLPLATSTYVLHPDYNASNLDNDIGLIQLRLPITFTDYIKPINKLPVGDISPRVTTAIFGWGQISDSDAGLTDQLRYVSVVTMSNENCRLFYGNQITDRMMCAEGSYNEGTCYGDIGSALISHYSTGTSLGSVPVGVSSFLSSNGCESTDPSGFTRIFPYNTWIRNTTGISI